MLGPLELPLFPSCADCLAWSADGELAIGAGEYVQILTPKTANEKAEQGPAQKAINNWHSNRFRVNIFTNSEWPTIYPQKRDHFSLGGEQSLSTVVGLAWSPPGLAKYRRCVLAVFTSNLLLSLYEPVGIQGRWTRVAIVNDSLKLYFQPQVQDEGLVLQKSAIRSFSWSSPLKVPVAQQDADSLLAAGPESRWGFHLLSVANDAKDVIFLRVRGLTAVQSPRYTADVLSITSFDESPESHPQINPSSLFAAALQSKAVVSSMGWGPWTFSGEERQSESANAHHATGNLAVVYGTKLKMIKFGIDAASLRQGPDEGLFPEPVAESEMNTLFHSDELEDLHFTGPIKWINLQDTQKLWLAAGVFAGLALITIPHAMYKEQDHKSAQTRLEKFPFHEDTATDIQREAPRHWDPITSMTITHDPDSQDCTLHAATAGGYAITKHLNPNQEDTPLFKAPWKNQIDDMREQFDFDRDFGGLAVARIWGLTSYNGIVASATTLHPGDVIEYRTASEDRAIITFSTPTGAVADELPDAPTTITTAATSSLTPESPQTRRDAALRHILLSRDNEPPLCGRILYAAACSAIVESDNEDIIEQAREALTSLASATGADLSEELSKLSSAPGTIDAKSAAELSGPGSSLFERCDICEAGLSWYSTQEAQCAAGHLFAVRCGLTSLAIQDPGVSKFCSACGMEYLNEDAIDASDADLQRSCRTLFDMFDTCASCGGKFRL
ncbi:uncharacterized protein BO97DRAFT_390200 [Aspergillus homomorphus CBS 101889]|uniref:Transcription factor IIIC subunit delta N-term-domain-containing protein n=1 Tax=Aspergillus homomorphus (strain CBS 101889) TaxID=1450537 RepID=A0A395I064_ASPHC|nr:hypothetical protein BO97DRAFT_390200 [Aspergillus homomorphus CBS 101889]RAL12518.1 hypothetical protein BO97DRAFT_390200 [Aspergillus homomorphus CBS 101889]